MPGPEEKGRLGDERAVGDGQGPSLAAMSAVVSGGQGDGAPLGWVGVSSIVGGVVSRCVEDVFFPHSGDSER